MRLGNKIDCANPLNRAHPLNRGLQSDITVVPGLLNAQFNRAAMSSLDTFQDLAMLPGGQSFVPLAGGRHGWFNAGSKPPIDEGISGSPGGWGKSFSFGGGGTQYAVIGDPQGNYTPRYDAITKLANTFSLFVWIHPTDFTAINRIFGLWNDDAASPGWDFWLTATNAQPLFSTLDGTGANGRGVFATTGINLRTWTQVGFTYDGSDSIAGIHIYVNGEDVAVTTNTNTASGAFTSSQAKWGGGSTTHASFIGFMNKLRIFNRVVDAAEAKQQYKETRNEKSSIYRYVTLPSHYDVSDRVRVSQTIAATTTFGSIFAGIHIWSNLAGSVTFGPASVFSIHKKLTTNIQGLTTVGNAYLGLKVGISSGPWAGSTTLGSVSVPHNFDRPFQHIDGVCTFGTANLSNKWKQRHTITGATLVGSASPVVHRKLTNTIAGVVSCGLATPTTHRHSTTTIAAVVNITGNATQPIHETTTLHAAVAVGPVTPTTHRHSTTTIAATTAFGSASLKMRLTMTIAATTAVGSALLSNKRRILWGGFIIQASTLFAANSGTKKKSSTVISASTAVGPVTATNHRKLTNLLAGVTAIGGGGFVRKKLTSTLAASTLVGPVLLNTRFKPRMTIAGSTMLSSGIGLQGAAKFVGASNQYLSHVSNANLQTGNVDWWISFWIKTTNAGLAILASKTSSGWSGDWLVVGTGTNILFRILNSNVAIAACSQNVSYADNVWHNIFCYVDAVNQLAKISVDNAAFSSNAWVGTPAAGANDFVIANYSSHDFPFDGIVDSFAFGKSPPGGIAAIASTIKSTLWNSGNGVVSSAIDGATKTAWGGVGWWDFADMPNLLNDSWGSNPLTNSNGVTTAPGIPGGGILGTGPGAVIHRKLSHVIGGTTLLSTPANPVVHRKLAHTIAGTTIIPAAGIPRRKLVQTISPSTVFGPVTATTRRKSTNVVAGGVTLGTALAGTHRHSTARITGSTQFIHDRIEPARGDDDHTWQMPPRDDTWILPESND